MPARKPQAMFAVTETATVTTRGMRSRPGRTWRANLVSSMPIMSIMAPMIGAGKTENTPAMEAARKEPQGALDGPLDDIGPARPGPEVVLARKAPGAVAHGHPAEKRHDEVHDALVS